MPSRAHSAVVGSTRLLRWREALRSGEVGRGKAGAATTDGVWKSWPSNSGMEEALRVCWLMTSLRMGRGLEFWQKWSTVGGSSAETAAAAAALAEGGRVAHSGASQRAAEQPSRRCRTGQAQPQERRVAFRQNRMTNSLSRAPSDHDRRCDRQRKRVRAGTQDLSASHSVLPRRAPWRCALVFTAIKCRPNDTGCDTPTHHHPSHHASGARKCATLQNAGWLAKNAENTSCNK